MKENKGREKLSFLSKFIGRKVIKLRNENLRFYEEPMFQILESKETLDENFQLLFMLTTKYLSVYNDVNGITFYKTDKLPSSIHAVYQPKEEGEELIAWNSKLLQDKAEKGATEAYFKFFLVIAHETMHASDYRNAQKSGSKRDFASLAAKGMYEFMKYYPNKDYWTLSRSVYYLDRSEILARQGALKIQENFIDKYAIYLKKQGKLENNDTLKGMKDFLKRNQSLEKGEFSKAEHYRKQQIADFKKDLFVLSQELLSGKVHLESKDSLKNLTRTQASPQLYDEETLETFWKIAREKGYRDIEKACKKLKEQNKQYHQKQAQDFYKL